MLRLLKISLVASAALVVLVDARRSTPMWHFKKEISVHGKTIIPATPLPNEHDASFAYAVCDNRNSLNHFIETRCNVTSEKPLAPNVTRKRTCPIHIVPDNIENTEHLTQLSIALLGDDKAVFTWLQISKATSMAKLKIVKMTTCALVDVPIPVERIRFVVSYGDSLDIVLYSKTYCTSPICKVTLNADGQIVSEPTDILFKDVVSNAYNPLGPAQQHEHKAFYLSNRFTGDRSRLYKISSNGSGTEVTTFSVEKPFGYSSGYGFLSLCDSFTDTIACRVYNEETLEWVMGRTVEFHDKGLSRWLQPYNLQDGAVLLVTGRASDDKAQRFDHFGVFRLEANGQKYRKRLEIDNMNLYCESIRTLRVRVFESQDDSVCFYFSCTRKQLDKYKLQYTFKCYPKLYFSSVVPQTNGCFLTNEDNAITDFTIYA